MALWFVEGVLVFLISACFPPTLPSVSSFNYMEEKTSTKQREEGEKKEGRSERKIYAERVMLF
jgi:hypothetical protein